MEDMQLWAAYTSQVVALAAIFGATLGMLRKHDILTAEAMEKAFQIADEPARPGPSHRIEPADPHAHDG